MTWCEVCCLFGLNNFVIFIFLELPPPPPPHITLVLGLSRNPGELVYPQAKNCRQVKLRLLGL